MTALMFLFIIKVICNTTVKKFVDFYDDEGILAIYFTMMTVFCFVVWFITCAGVYNTWIK